MPGSAISKLIENPPTPNPPTLDLPFAAKVPSLLSPLPGPLYPLNAQPQRPAPNVWPSTTEVPSLPLHAGSLLPYTPGNPDLERGKRTADPNLSLRPGGGGDCLCWEPRRLGCARHSPRLQSRLRLPGPGARLRTPRPRATKCAHVLPPPSPEAACALVAGSKSSFAETLFSSSFF